MSATLSPNKIWLRALERSAAVTPESRETLAMAVEAMATRQGPALALLSARETLTYAQLAARTRLYARWGLREGLAKGAVVALLMPNQPEYLAIWLGLTRIGVVVALLNTNLTGAALAHCLRAADAQALIVAPGFEAAARAATALLEQAPTFWAAADLVGQDDGPLQAGEERDVTLADRALLVYTSGTTGLPKAAHVSHHRIMSWSAWFSGLLGAGGADRLYDCLPMYHSVGGVMGPGAMLVSGGSAFLREKFSASAFWGEIAEYECTLFQYIGELCRYLLKAPPHALERGHGLRMMFGNGLSGEVWTPFQERFAIPAVLEFYAATEGNVSLYNVEGRPGAIGRIPGFLSHRFPLALVRFDEEREAPLRNADGHCIRCATGETGEAIGWIDPSRGAGGRFEGYTSAADSAKKLLRDVFKPGDAWFRTGDLMRADAQGFYYFVNRIGDTFRWKGENVAAAEVAAMVGQAPGVVDALIYGVTVPGAEGRAGMAALVTQSGFTIAALAQSVAALPTYARPVFVRLTSAIAMTETFKPKKAALQAEGFDPGKVADPLYVLEGAAYLPLDAGLHARILSGEFRL